jgi:OOP family OmpA-OmpF porin
MKVLTLVLWLLLGVFYWWMWGNNNGNCCLDNADASSSNIEAGALAGAADTEEIDSLSADLGESDTSGQKGNSEEDLDGDGIPDAEQDFTEEDVSSIDVAAIDPNESSGDEAKVVETENTALIHFPYNSTYKLDSKAIEEYLNKVAQRVQQSKESIRLTGHGDITGTDNSNMQIGQYRANAIRDYLVSKGVNPQQITTTSKGRSQPIASNKTREGRTKNRRVELVIEKQ